MKKTLILILIGLLLILSVFIAIKGFSIGNIEVMSYTQIRDKNEKLDESIQQASKLAEKDYKQAVANVQENGKKLSREKKTYEEMTATTEEGAEVTSQLEQYEIETLWVKLGNHATTEGAIIKMDVVKGNTSKTYDLRFTVNGSYISITDFISDIENDSTLGFKIEEFKMLPAENSSELKATFICREIAIKDISALEETTTDNEEDADTDNNTNTTKNTSSNTTNTNSTNNTNSAKTNNTSNSTKTTNTSNSSR